MSLYAPTSQAEADWQAQNYGPQGGMGGANVKRGGLNPMQYAAQQRQAAMQRAGMGGYMGVRRGGVRQHAMNQMNQMGAQDWQGLLAQEAAHPGSTDPNMLRTGLGMMGINANDPNSIAPRNGMPGQMGQPPMGGPPQMRPQPGFSQPDWQGIFGPSLNNAQVQAHQSQIRQQQGGMFNQMGRNFRNNMQGLGQRMNMMMPGLRRGY